MLTARKRGRPAQPGLAESRREEILLAATKLFARDGFARTDLQRVADELGVGKGTVYRYWRSKEELFLGTVDRAMRLMREAIDEAIEGETDPLKRVERAVRAYLEFFEGHREFVELLIQERAAFRDRKKPTYFEHREANRGRWREMFQGLIKSGVLRDVPVDRMMDVLSAVVYGTMFTNFFLSREKAGAKQAEDIIDVVLRGILNTSGQSGATR